MRLVYGRASGHFKSYTKQVSRVIMYSRGENMEINRTDIDGNVVVTTDRQEGIRLIGVYNDPEFGSYVQASWIEEANMLGVMGVFDNPLFDKAAVMVYGEDYSRQLKLGEPTAISEGMLTLPTEPTIVKADVELILTVTREQVLGEAGRLSLNVLALSWPHCSEIYERIGYPDAGEQLEETVALAGLAWQTT